MVSHSYRDAHHDTDQKKEKGSYYWDYPMFVAPGARSKPYTFSVPAHAQNLRDKLQLNTNPDRPDRLDRPDNPDKSEQIHTQAVVSGYFQCVWFVLLDSGLRHHVISTNNISQTHSSSHTAHVITQPQSGRGDERNGSQTSRTSRTRDLGDNGTNTHVTSLGDDTVLVMNMKDLPCLSPVSSRPTPAQRRWRKKQKQKQKQLQNSSSKA